jgi:pantothenate kinase type III
MMQGLITLDFGNSHPHAGLFHKNQDSWKLVKVVPFPELKIFLSQLQMTATNSTLVLSEVKAREEELFPFLREGFLLTRVKDYWRGSKFGGMPVHYTSTLGEDRLIQSFFLFKKDKAPTLLIDAGTYVTMDVINENGFQGGYIIPSQENYFETYKKGEQLKDVCLNSSTNFELPQDTAEAMSKSYQAFVALAKSTIEKFGITKIIVTGGKGSWWKETLSQEVPGIHVKEEKDLVHLALHYWMTTQIEPL